MAKSLCLLLVLVGAYAAAVHASSDPKIFLPYSGAHFDTTSAYTNSVLCLKNGTSDCPASFLTASGKLNVGTENATLFCSPECQAQLQVQFSCINKTTNYGEIVHFRFTNGAQFSDVNTAIATGCSSGNFTVKPTVKGSSYVAASAGAMLVGLASSLALALLF